MMEWGFTNALCCIGTSSRPAPSRRNVSPMVTPLPRKPGGEGPEGGEGAEGRGAFAAGTRTAAAAHGGARRRQAAGINGRCGDPASGQERT